MTSPDSIAALTRRIEQLESFVARFGFKPEPERDAAPPMAQLAPASVAEPAAARPANMPPPLPPRPASHAAPKDLRSFQAAIAAAKNGPAPSPIGPSPTAAATFAPASPRIAPSPPVHAGVEQALGLKVAGWIGALVIAIAAAMGVKFAYDQGWLGGMPAEVKLAALYGAALALIVAGEWTYRRVNPLAAVGLYAAGIASLFVVAYAGFGYFNLYGQTPAFVLMAAAGAIGMLIALRGRFASIAVLSHLGANVAPFVLRDQGVGEVPLLAYLLVLQLMAVTLANIGKGGRWWTLRTLALVTTSLWVAGRLVSPMTAHTTATITFAAIYAVVFQLELVVLVLRRGQTDETASSSSFSAPTFSLAVTGAFVGALLAWTTGYPAMERGLHLVALSAILAIAAAATFANAARPALRALATSWLTQAALLIFIAIPIALEGPAVTCAWGGLAVAYGVLGFALRRSRTIVAGGIVWMVAALHLAAKVAIAPADDSLRHAWTTIDGIDWPAYLILAIGLGVAGHAIALLGGAKRLNRSVEQFADVIAVFATAVWTVALVSAVPPLTATLGLLIAGWLLLGIRLVSGRRVFGGIAVALVVLVLAKWAAIDVLGERLSNDPPTRQIFLNSPMAVGVACVVSLLAMLRIVRQPGAETRSAHVAWAAVVMGIVALTIGLSVEVERAANEAVARGSAWPAAQLTMFGWTILWMAAVRLPAMVGRVVDDSPERLRLAQHIGDIATLMLTLKFIVADSIVFALSSPRVAVTPLANLHGMLALGVVVALIRMGMAYPRGHAIGGFARGMIFAVPLVYGSIELDRAVGPQQTMIAWSIFWSTYAVASIVLGFARGSAAFRFAGLGLLAITLLKIVLVDLASAATGWRILSFLAVGGVLLLTSVIYGKLSPKLLPDADPVPSPGTPGEG